MSPWLLWPHKDLGFKSCCVRRHGTGRRAQILLLGSWQVLRGADLQTSLSLSFHIFFFLTFWPSCSAWGVLAPQPGIKPMPPAVEAQSPNHWPPGRSRSAPSLGGGLAVCVFGCPFVVPNGDSHRSPGLLPAAAEVFAAPLSCRCEELS